MIRIAILGIIAMLCLSVTSAPTLAPAPEPVLEAGGCGWWICGSSGELTPSLYVCRATCNDDCSPIWICASSDVSTSSSPGMSAYLRLF